MSTTTSDDESSPRVSASRTPKVLALVVLWLAPEAQRGGSRLGEVLLMPEGACPPPCVFGRGDDTDDDPRTARLAFLRQRPGANASTPPLELSSLSRRQLLLRVVDGAIHVENVGRRDLVVDGNVVQRCVLRRGDMLEIKNRVVLMCVERPLYLPPLRSWQEQHSGAFGDADAFGFVGESPSAWALREQIAFVAPRNAHVLVTGESGTGKELAAHAVHGLSPRRRHRIVARNAATIPSGLVDAELFGNVAHYPNAGSPDRPGLVGEADESTLFLDEIGELPEDVQTHLLRVADASGDYQRLGESRRRRASFRLVGATNRSLDRIKPDLLARLPLRIVVPGLHERREDIPLLVRVLLQRLAESDAEIGERFFDAWDGKTGAPRVTPALVSALVRHPYTTHVRELVNHLWCAIATSEADTLDLTGELRAELAGRPELPQRTTGSARPEIGEEELREAMRRHNGVQSRVWRELGLANRYVLQRLLRRYAIRG